MPEGSYLDSALYVSSLDSVRFSWGGPGLPGEIDSGSASWPRSLPSWRWSPRPMAASFTTRSSRRAASCAKGCGRRSSRRSRRRAACASSCTSRRTSPSGSTPSYWELLTDHGRHLALARSPDTAFSRYLGVRRAPGTPFHPAAPPALRHLRAVRPREIRPRRDQPRRSRAAPQGPFRACWPKPSMWPILEPPATLGRLRQRLMADGGFHLLHFFGHGHEPGWRLRSGPGRRPGAGPVRGGGACWPRSSWASASCAS